MHCPRKGPTTEQLACKNKARTGPSQDRNLIIGKGQYIITIQYIISYIYIYIYKYIIYYIWAGIYIYIYIGDRYDLYDLYGSVCELYESYARSSYWAGTLMGR